MDEQGFARALNGLYRELYRIAVRRVDDGRERVSAETTALLLHLAQAGPMTLSEIALHFGRALSTLSAKVAVLEAQGLLSRQRDTEDARRADIWLSPAGRVVLDEAMEVLDTPRLALAAARLEPARRDQLLQSLRELIAAVPSPPVSTPGDRDHEPLL